MSVVMLSTHVLCNIKEKEVLDLHCPPYDPLIYLI
jgi:hypothetical protein